MAEPIASTIFNNIGAIQNFSNGKQGIVKITVGNTTAGTGFLQLFDADQASVTLGTTVPREVIICPGTNGFVTVDYEPQLLYSTKISGAFTTTATGNTAVGAGAFAQFFVN